MTHINLSLILFVCAALSACFFLYWFAVPQRFRASFLALASIIFIASYSIKYACYFLFNVGLVYLAAVFMEKNRGSGKTWLRVVLFWLVTNLCFFKYSRILQIPALKVILPLGTSYIIFRLIHYIVEVYRKRIPRGAFIDLAEFVLFFPTFLAGPVDRFQNFYPQSREPKILDVALLNEGLGRIALGLLKKFVVADQLAGFIMPVLSFPQSHPSVSVLASVYGLAIMIYMDFSGYTDMAVGTARLFGYRIMENFDRPFLKANIALFWRSWHISVYSWIRDYFFLPLFGYRAREIKVYTGIFCSMIVFMLWHQGTLSFLVLGIYHGLGLILWQIFQEAKRRYPGLRRLVARPYLDPFSTFFTFTFVSFGFIFFAFDTQAAGRIMQRLL